MSLTGHQVDSAIAEWYHKSRVEANKKNGRAAPGYASHDSAWASLGYRIFNSDQEPVWIPGLGFVEVVDDFDEEFHTDHYVVIKVWTDPDHGEGEVQYWKRNGWRASHDGSYLDGPTERVYPKTVTVTKWETTR